MSSNEDKISKFREERMAREKARLEKLRQLNLKKYNQYDLQQKRSSSSVSLPKSNPGVSCPPKNNMKVVTNNLIHVNDTNKRPIPAIPKKAINYVTANKNVASQIIHKKGKQNNCGTSKVNKTDDYRTTCDKNNTPFLEIGTENIKKISTNCELPVTKNKDNNQFIIQQKVIKNKAVVNDEINSKAICGPSSSANTKRESVFDRLFKQTKVLPKQKVDNAHKLRTDPTFLRKLIKDSEMIIPRRETLVEPEEVIPIRRSYSAVHLKKNSNIELENCVHKWASIGEKIDSVHLKNKIEDGHVMDERIVSAVKSERKRAIVTFQTPSNFNTPRAEELQSRLISWLQKRGKSLESYHHLQCFGVHHLSKQITPVKLDTNKNETDENKENIALEHDSDNDSFDENINGDLAAANKVVFPVNSWRRASNDSIDYNESLKTPSISSETIHHVDELLVGVLNDLTELLREGFDSEQCARWLRVVRERFPCCLDCASYWECRAALEERCGDLPASLQCWEQAVANGTKYSVAEANLDNLLDKFMHLKISPSSGKPQVDPKLVDVKNVFKSTIIRFGVQQAKLRKPSEPMKFTVTPVRRSSRLSVYPHTSLRVCSTLQEAAELGPIEFVPNKALNNTP